MNNVTNQKAVIMKDNYQKVFMKGLKYAIDLALVLLIIVVFVGVFTTLRLSRESTSNLEYDKTFTSATMSSPLNNIMFAFSNPDLGKNIGFIKRRFNLSILLIGSVNVVALILILLQLKFIFMSFSQADFFHASNSVRIKKIAIIIFIWVLADYIVRFIPGILIPNYFVSSTIGVNTLSPEGIPRIFGFNFKMLIISVIIYVLSIVFKYGNEIKEESSLII